MHKSQMIGMQLARDLLGAGSFSTIWLYQLLVVGVSIDCESFAYEKAIHGILLVLME
jgi:hypothetical protein